MTWGVRLAIVAVLPFVVLGWLVAIPVYVSRRGFGEPDGRY